MPHVLRSAGLLVAAALVGLLAVHPVLGRVPAATEIEELLAARGFTCSTAPVSGESYSIRTCSNGDNVTPGNLEAVYYPDGPFAVDGTFPEFSVGGYVAGQGPPTGGQLEIMLDLAMLTCEGDRADVEDFLKTSLVHDDRMDEWSDAGCRLTGSGSLYVEGYDQTAVLLVIDPRGSGAPSATSSPATPGASGSPTCLDERVVAAFDDLQRGDSATDPPPSEIADALDGLDLTGSQDEARDRLVRNLRVPPDNEIDLILAISIFRSEVAVATCGPAGSPPASPGAEESPAAGPADPGAGEGGGGAGGPSRPFASTIPQPAEVSFDPIVLLQSALLAALLVFLMPFPSQLFNSTLETNEDEVRRWLRLGRAGSLAGRFGAFWASWPGVALFTLLAAALYGFLDPGFGLNASSLPTFLGMLAGIVLTTGAFAIPVVLAHRRHGDRPSLKVVPVSLVIGIACVVLSRLTDFQPGYLYGLLIGLGFARELSAQDEGRATAWSAVAMLGVALVAWLGLGALPEGDGFALVALRTALAALMVAGLEGVVFGLLPMRFLPGASLYAWNRIVWGGLLGLGVFAFFHILINPASGYLSDTSRTPLLTVLALLVGFSVASVAFWAWFRFRPGTAEPREP